MDLERGFVGGGQSNSIAQGLDNPRDGRSAYSRGPRVDLFEAQVDHGSYSRNLGPRFDHSSTRRHETLNPACVPGLLNFTDCPRNLDGQFWRKALLHLLNPSWAPLLCR